MLHILSPNFSFIILNWSRFRGILLYIWSYHFFGTSMYIELELHFTFLFLKLALFLGWNCINSFIAWWSLTFFINHFVHGKRILKTSQFSPIFFVLQACRSNCMDRYTKSIRGINRVFYGRSFLVNSRCVQTTTIPDFPRPYCNDNAKKWNCVISIASQVTIIPQVIRSFSFSFLLSPCFKEGGGDIKVRSIGSVQIGAIGPHGPRLEWIPKNYSVEVPTMEGNQLIWKRYANLNLDIILQP